MPIIHKEGKRRCAFRDRVKLHFIKTNNLNKVALLFSFTAHFVLFVHYSFISPLFLNLLVDAQLAGV